MKALIVKSKTKLLNALVDNDDLIELKVILARRDSNISAWVRQKMKEEIQAEKKSAPKKIFV